eukprot:SAG22_NODE_13050_length_420_cov_1.352025_1_plen_28_part_01
MACDMGRLLEDYAPDRTPIPKKLSVLTG